jgi:serine/threonine-protein kinase RsbW
MAIYTMRERFDELRRREAELLDCHALWKSATLFKDKEIVPFVDALTTTMPRHRYHDKDIFATRILLEEAILNAFRHGNCGDPAKGVHIRYCVDPDRVLVQVEDEGCGFDPDQVPDPTSPENIDRSSGRGLLLMKHYATWLDYNERGNCVTLCKRSSIGARGPHSRR